MYNGMKVLDVHSHIHDVSMTDRTLQPRLGSPFWSTLASIPGLGASRPLPSPIGPGKHSDQPGNRDEDFQFVAAHLEKYIDDRSIDAQILSPHPLQFHGWMEDDMHFKSWIAYQNDLAFKLVQGAPARFVASCQLPQRADATDTTHCIEELERCVDQYAVVAAYVSPDIDGKHSTPPMNMPYWDPLYQRCQDLELPIIVHGTDVQDPWFRSMGVQRYFEFNFLPPQSMATAILRESDVFQRFPGLKIIVCHCGGYIERLGPGAQFRSKERTHLDNLYYDTSAYDVDFLAAAIKQRGIPSMVFGTEAPGSGTEIRPGTEYTADDLVPMFASDPALSFLTEQDKADILHNGPAKLFPGLASAEAQNAKAKVKAF